MDWCAVVARRRVARRGVARAGRIVPAALAGLVVALASGWASAGEVRGRLAGYTELVNPVWAEAKKPQAHGYTFREPVSTVSAKMRRLFPYIPAELAVVLIAPESAPKMRAVDVMVAGGRTSSVTLVVTPGTALKFKNADPFTHRLYAVGQNGFSAAPTQAGEERTWAVPGPGVYEIRDEAFPSLRMWVVSEPNVAAVAHPSLDGRFALVHEVPGQYVVRAYFAGKQVGAELPAPLAAPAAVLDISRTPLVVATPKSKPTEGQ